MKRLKVGVATVAFCAIAFAGTTFKAEPASAQDGFCGYLWAKRQVLYMMVDVLMVWPGLRGRTHGMNLVWAHPGEP